MGANALVCKPMESFLPIVAAMVLKQTNYYNSSTMTTTDEMAAFSENDNASQKALFYLLVGPPLVFSLFQILAWRRYDLTPERTKRLKEELKEMQVLDDNRKG
jgi:Na+/melibiose symporter-like transporter